MEFISVESDLPGSRGCVEKRERTYHIFGSALCLPLGDLNFAALSAKITKLTFTTLLHASFILGAAESFFLPSFGSAFLATSAFAHYAHYFCSFLIFNAINKVFFLIFTGFSSHLAKTFPLVLAASCGFLSFLSSPAASQTAGRPSNFCYIGLKSGATQRPCS